MSDSLPEYRVVADSRLHTKRPLFSVIVAVYEVENYIAQTLKSFKKQDINSEDIEYVIVDDGSPDNAVDIAGEFVRHHPNVVVITKHNGGVAETRKLGLALARGEWVTAVDPDDLLKSDYFSEAKRFLDQDVENQISILSSRVFITDGDSGKFRDSHPLGGKFKRGNRVVSMLAEPSAIQMGATVFMRLDVLREHNLTFDTRINPTFEDGNLVCRYLAHFENPTVGLLSTSHYYYRKRADSSSLVQSSWLKEERYTVVPELGYLAAMEYVKEKQGYIPDWLANIVLYDMMWYFKEDEKMGSAVASISHELKAQFMESARKIFGMLNANQLVYMPMNKPSWRLRESLMSGFGLDRAPARIFKWGTREDGTRNYSVVAPPGEHDFKIYSAGKLISVVPEGITNRLYFDEVLAVEYTLNLPDVPTAFFIDGVPCAPSSKAPAQELPETPEYFQELTRKIRADQPTESRLAKIVECWRVAGGIRNQSPAFIAWERFLNRCKSTLARRTITDDERIRRHVDAYIESGEADKFEHAWLILDHADRADDNAEHLYRYILHNHDNFNAYFLLERTSSDWERLEAEGFRLLEYGSTEAMAAALKADIVASSDAVEECIYPAPRRIFGAPNYKFVFLQHGITKDDISRWLNGKKIDLVVAATSDEYRAFTWENSPYEYKYTQVALTGFPRYDNLYRLVSERTDRSQGPRTVFIMPTWRQDLRDSLKECANEQEELEVLLNSDFYTNWWSFLNNADLQQRISRGEIKVRMMLHPGLAVWMTKLPAVPGIEFLHPAEYSFQELMNQADVFVTDYSSLAFDCAFMGTPVVYFQFDRDRMLSGVHTYRKGYFDYYDDGLGPVVMTAEELNQWLAETLEGDCEMTAIYQGRRQQTFAYLDGNNSERVFKVMTAMVDGTWPQSLEGLYTVPNNRKLS